MNKWIAIGHLCNDPEMRYTPDGSAVTKFRIAVNNYKDSVTFMPIVTWKKLAETCGEYLKKGSHVCIEGRIEIREYEKDGQKRFATECIAQSMKMLDKKDSQ